MKIEAVIEGLSLRYFIDLATVCIIYHNCFPYIISLLIFLLCLLPLKGIFLNNYSKTKPKSMRKNLLLKMLSLFLVLITSMAWAQDKTVTGKVTSKDDGSTLPGVNIVVKGTTNGSVTDADGKYSIIASSGSTLIISFIGFATQEIAVGERTVIDIPLLSDITQLQEVVVTALGVEKSPRELGFGVTGV